MFVFFICVVCKIWCKSFWVLFLCEFCFELSGLFCCMRLGDGVWVMDGLFFLEIGVLFCFIIFLDMFVGFVKFDRWVFYRGIV